MITFQELIRRLTDFWEKQGCIIHQGYDLETGAGTFNPATFLRSLGPEPYAAAYVEPSRRPKDGRYGENPNRLQLFHQYQVIVKPSPENIQALYLQSLEAVGLHLKEHDIRFVHDDWEAPTQGAWGLGWEVWIDGMEATQFTYFQMVGSQPLNPIPVELTYGLERLAMFLQGVDHFLDLKWNESLTFRDIALEQEIEWSTYNFKAASTTMWQRHFEDFEGEAKSLIAQNLPLPAYDFVIKASHAFNILDARGAISVTERTGTIARIRELSRLIASAYLSSREALGFPLSPKEKALPLPSPLPPLTSPFDPEKKDDFLLEIGSEELPATFVPIGIKSLESKLRAFLKEFDLPFDALETFATPRRLAVLIKGLCHGTQAKEITKRGPKLQAAFTKEGSLTVQGAGFFKSICEQSVTLDAIKRGKVAGITIQNETLFFTQKVEGQSARSLLQEHLSKLILQIDFPKKMRWGSGEIAYARPLHWIAALHGDAVIPFSLGEIRASNMSYGHAQRSPQKITIKKPAEYAAQLEAHAVLASVEKRKEVIVKQLLAIEKEQNMRALETERVLQEVLYLTEYPELTVATFDPKYLEAPKEVLILEMVTHQRYFPLSHADGTLAHLFVITADNTPSDLIRKGNQKVLSARLADGVFLFKKDLATPLQKFNATLKTMTFQKELGSVFDKVVRIMGHAKTINDALSLADDIHLARAAELCKADLASELVKEFPELQGVIGSIYAKEQGENGEVVTALYEHWLPIKEGGELPRTPVGIVLSLADKIDNLLASFALGLKPTSSSDPYALRRQTIGILKTLLQEKLSADFPKLLQACAKHFSTPLSSSCIEEIVHFATVRAKGVFEEMGYEKNSVAACLKPHLIDPLDQLKKVEALSHVMQKEETFSKLAEVYKRVKGLLHEKLDVAFDPSLAKESAEKGLIQALERLEKGWKTALLECNYTKAFELMAALQPPLATLLDTVKILCEDPKQRGNRIALLQRIFAHFDELLSFDSLFGGS